MVTSEYLCLVFGSHEPWQNLLKWVCVYAISMLSQKLNPILLWFEDQQVWAHCNFITLFLLWLLSQKISTPEFPFPANVSFSGPKRYRSNRKRIRKQTVMQTSLFCFVLLALFASIRITWFHDPLCPWMAGATNVFPCHCFAPNQFIPWRNRLRKGPFFLFPLKRGLESSPGSVRHRIQQSFNCNTRELGSDC